MVRMDEMWYHPPAMIATSSATRANTEVPASPGAERPFRDALLRALARAGGGDDPTKALDTIADKLVGMAVAGDLHHEPARREMTPRWEAGRCGKA